MIDILRLLLTIIGRVAFLALFELLSLIYALSKVASDDVKAAKRQLRLRLPAPAKATLFVFLAMVSLTVGFWALILKDLPLVRGLASRKVEASTKIYDRNGTLLYTIYEDKNRTPVKLSKVPQEVKLATLAAEDAQFYSHPGISIKGIARASLKYITKRQVSGGSTITQQLVKNALLNPEQTLPRKIKEIILALRVEGNFEKDEILEMYLNEVSYGGAAYGIQEASRLYFGKDVQALSLAEASLLAGLPKSPTTLSPFGANPELAMNRQKMVLSSMLENGFITKEQYEKASSQSLVFAENKIDIKAPHFVMYVSRLLVERYGEDLVEKGGLEVITTLDYRLQQMAEKVVAEEVDKLSGQNVGNGAAVVLDPATGQVLAMVGSKNYFDQKIEGQVNVTLRPRQPGSSIKIVTYANALLRGFTPATPIEDSPVTFHVEGQPPYTPKNYDGKFRGTLTLRSAFAESRNIPAVKTLNNFGLATMIDMGRKMGITSWKDESNYGLSLTLGGGEVTLLELSRVYSTVAGYGKRPDISTVMEVRGNDGEVLYVNPCAAHCEKPQVMDERVAFILGDILRDNSARAPGFGTNSLLNIPGHPEVSVKTGTSNNLRDNVAVGFTRDYTVASWVGNNDNTPMSRVSSGITGATPIWHRITKALVSAAPSREWHVPEGLVRKNVCAGKTEWFLKENQPNFNCEDKYFALTAQNQI